MILSSQTNQSLKIMSKSKSELIELLTGQPTTKKDSKSREDLISLLTESDNVLIKSPFPVFYEKLIEKSNKKIISFSLYGDKPLYYLGMQSATLQKPNGYTQIIFAAFTALKTFQT